MTVRIVQVDRGLRGLLRRVLGRARLTVGVHKPEGRQARQDSPTATVAQVAASHEYGTTTHKARPFISTFAEANKQAIDNELRAAAVATMQGTEKRAAVEQAGANLAELMKAGMPAGETQGAITHRVRGVK